MKSDVKVGVQIVLALVLALSGILSSATGVRAEEPDDIVLATFATTLSYNQPGNDFTNGEVIGSRGWWNSIENRSDEAVMDLTLDLNSELTLDNFSVPPETMGPSTYSWTFGTLPVGATIPNIVFNEQNPSPVSYIPGFDASRTVDVPVFTESGTQILTVTVDPQETINSIMVQVTIPPNQIANTAYSDWAVTDDNGPVEHSVYQVGTSIVISQMSPDAGSIYTFKVWIEVDPNVAKTEFIPQVGVTVNKNMVFGPAGTSSSLIHEVDGLGTWTVSAGEEHPWNVQEFENKSVVFPSSIYALGEISGSVQNDTGTPINGATIVAFPVTPGLIRVTSSGEDGRYLMENLPIGNYYMRAIATEYISQWYDGEDFLANRDMVTVISGDVSDINFSLRPDAGSMSGYVYEADGLTPVNRAFVDMYTYDGATWILAYRTASQPDGSYLMPSLKPGDYKVRAWTGGYLDEWYEEGFSDADAILVTITALAETSGINFSLSQLYETPAGDNIIVNDIYNEVTVTFATVIEDGSTSINVAEYDPSDGTIEFRVVGKYYDISTDASYDGTITITITYDDTGLQKPEENLKLWHWDGTHWSAVDCVIDEEENTITAIVDSLSWFAVGEFNDFPVAEAAVTTYLAPVEAEFIFDGSNSIDPDGIIVTYEWDFGDSNGSGILETPSVTHSYAEPGVYNVILTVTDDSGAQSTSAVMVVVYDPEGGFVTGGGWIDSPEGAYTLDPSLTGKATFGFVSKYKKDATVPTGQTEFQFKAGDSNFHSSSYDWLIVTGSDYARFKGTGTINGEGEYKFQIWAGDGTGVDGADTFRIKIWMENESGDEIVVYDNGMNQPIGGGNIVVHTSQN
ncbi:MAG: carboxypeptidase regulatory-like domain-containing protein [Dehalococcoidales bacterium]|nr:MAG: carboxypeptidase regulatory-like domain-containing protein [Dehalococcoidales bacterium]